MKFTSLFALSLVIGLAVQAQGKAAGSNDPEAKKILDAVSAKFQTYKTVQASFSYKVENATGKVLSSKSGTILMKGTRYKLNFSGLDVYCNGTTVWNFDKAANEVTVNNLDASSGMITPQKLFSNFYDKDFYYLLNGEKKVGNKVIQEIQMTPVDKSKNFHTVYLLIDKAAQSLYSTKVLEKSGSRYSYTVSGMKTNLPAADGLFQFDSKKFPGVNVEDLR